MVFENFLGGTTKKSLLLSFRITFMITEETDVPRCSVKKIIKFPRKVPGECVRFSVKLLILDLNVY